MRRHAKPHRRSAATVTELAEADLTRLARVTGVLRETAQAHCALCGIPLEDAGQVLCTRCAYR